MQIEDIKTKVRSHIEEFILYGDSLQSDDESLVQSGVVDSSGVMELVLFVEDEFRIQLKDDDIIPENIDTVSSLAALIQANL